MRALPINVSGGWQSVYSVAEIRRRAEDVDQDQDRLDRRQACNYTTQLMNRKKGHS